MRRLLPNFVAAISSLAFVAATVFWVRSYQFPENGVGESLNFRRTDPLWWVISHRGTLTLCRQNGKEWGKEFGKVEGFGFRFGGLKGPNGSLWNLQFPYWFITAAATVTPALWLLRLRRSRRRRGGRLCLTCGYDLRASRDRCPECGTAIPQMAPQV